MAFCHACGEERPEIVAMDQIVQNGPPMPVRKCDRGHRISVAPIPDHVSAHSGKILTKIAPEVVHLRKPGELLRAAKRRLREIKKELAYYERLKKERDELSRLIAASKPIAKVRTLKVAQ